MGSNNLCDALNQVVDSVLVECEKPLAVGTIESLLRARLNFGKEQILGGPEFTQPRLPSAHLEFGFKWVIISRYTPAL